jgi:hypothetical protein
MADADSVSPDTGVLMEKRGRGRPRGSKNKPKDASLVTLSSASAKRLMTHKYRGCIVVLSINKSVEPNKEQKVLTSGFDQGFTVNTSKRVFRDIW